MAGTTVLLGAALSSALLWRSPARPGARPLALFLFAFPVAHDAHSRHLELVFAAVAAAAEALVAGGSGTAGLLVRGVVAILLSPLVQRLELWLGRRIDAARPETWPHGDRDRKRSGDASR